LPPPLIVEPLIAFSLAARDGSSFGQLTVITFAFLRGAWFRGRPWYRARAVIPASALIPTTGLTWRLERALS